MEYIKQKKKFEKLFHFCIANGFTPTVDEIVTGIEVSRKTFFNRYENREKMVETIRHYWRSLFYHRFKEKSELCNNAVEIILLFIYEIQFSHQNELVFIEKELQTEDYLLLKSDKSFSTSLTNMVRQGIETNCFHTDIDVELYVHFFLLNTFNLYLKDYNIEFISYIIEPLLTSFGKTILEDIDLIRMFSSNQASLDAFSSYFSR